MSRDKALDLCKIFDGKKPKSLSLFLKIINKSEEEFYSMVKNHIVSPAPRWDQNEMKKNKSNITPSDFDSWLEKFS